MKNIVKENYDDIIIQEIDNATIIKLFNYSIDKSKNDKPKKITIFNHELLSEGNTDILIYSSNDDINYDYKFIKFDVLIIKN